MLRRIFLFVLTNLAFILTFSIICFLFDLTPYATKAGIDYQALLIFCFIWGFVGAFISLAMSRWMVKKMLDVHPVNPTAPGEYSSLLNKLSLLSKQANLPSVPELGIWQSDEVNAFATGPSKRSSLVVVSTGLLEEMDESGLEGVLAHELSHIKSGDMVTLTLIQGVINAFVMFFARIAAFAVGQAIDEDLGTISEILLIILFEVIFAFAGFIVVCHFSRKREFRADEAAARLAGRETMVSALTTLLKLENRKQAKELPDALTAFAFSGSNIGKLFQTHPPLGVRIRKLRSS